MTPAQQAQAAPDARQPGTYPWLRRYPEGVDWHEKFEPVPMPDLLDATVVRYGSRSCSNFLGKVMTYR